MGVKAPFCWADKVSSLGLVVESLGRFLEGPLGVCYVVGGLFPNVEMCTLSCLLTGAAVKTSCGDNGSPEP